MEFTGATPAVFRQREERTGPAYEPLFWFANARSVQLLAAPDADLTRLLPKADLTFAPTVPAQLNTGTELWRWLLAAALLFLVVESLLAWRSVSESAEGGK